jgi:putative ABC transport system substrate-binding protein
MRRRDFIAALGTAAAWPLVARGQQTAMPVVGILNSTTIEAFREYLAEFRRGLAELGYVEGRNVAFEHRAAEDHYARLPGLADDLVRLRVAVISGQIAISGRCRRYSQSADCLSRPPVAEILLSTVAVLH